MKVLLIKDVKSLGKAGEVVEVKDGYGQNFLIAKGFAKAATNEVLNRYKAEQKKAAQVKELEAAEIAMLARKVAEVVVVLKKKVGANDALFGAVTKEEIASALETHHIFVDKKCVEMEPIKHLGEFEVTLKLGGGIHAGLKVRIEPDF